MNAQNGHAGMRFDGDLLSHATAALAQPLSMYFVVSCDDTAVNIYSGTTVLGAMATTNWHIHHSVFNGVNSYWAVYV